MIDYETIKAVAKETGRRVTDLIALAPQNDPFYVGTPTSLRNAQWFANLWARFGYTSGVHLRRVHYQIISQHPAVLMPNGLPYENTEGCWDLLVQASGSARYLGSVDPAAFEDHRAPAAIVNVPERPERPYIVAWADETEDTHLPDFPTLPDYYVQNYEGRQRYHVEVWAEKSTMNDVLLPLCERYGANLQTGLGEMSITSCFDLIVRRLATDAQPARVLYVSDFDPAGQGMPVSVSRKIEYFIRQQFPALDVRLIPVVLTVEQVRTYHLPRTPIKETERRKAGFEDRYGEGATELDALEALHPGTLRSIMEAEIRRYHDRDLTLRVYQAGAQLRSDLQDQRREILVAHAEEIAALQAEYEQLRAEFEERMASHSQRRSALWQTITGELHAAKPDISEYPIPEAGAGNEHTGALYDSSRDYWEQNDAYKVFQGKSREAVAEAS